MNDEIQRAIEALTGRTVAAKLREIMPVIDAKVREGVRHEEIIEALADAGMDVKLNTFRSNLYRYRKKRGKVRKGVKPVSERQQAHGNAAVADAGNADVQEAGSGAEDFEAALDPKRREQLGEKYLERRPAIIGKRRSDSK